MPTSRSVLIVGGSSGIGRAAAQAFLDAGDLVTIAGRSPERLQQAADSLTGTAATETVDAMSEEAVAALFARLAHLDDLVVTVGSAVPMGGFRDLGPEALRQAFDAKLMTQARVAHHALQRLAPDGSITFVGGLAGRRPLPGMSPVAVANMGLEGLTSILAKELAPLRVNAVVPGLIDTPAYDGMPAEVREAMMSGAAQSLPVGRVGRAEDVGAAVAALARNGFITGTTLEVDGGAHL